MKKSLLLLALLAVFAFSACSSDSTSQAPSSLAVPSSAAPSTSPSETEHIIMGTVEDATMNTLTIQTEDGSEYSFGTEGATINTAGGDYVIGATVTVFYEGALDEGSEGQDVTVTNVDVTGTGERSVSGTVVDATMNTLTIEAADGAEYSFDTQGADVSASDGLVLGDGVTVYYTGTGTLDANSQPQDVTVTLVVVH